MRSLTVYAALGYALLLYGCVTINIYFPAAAAEKAADKIIDEVWQLKNPESPPHRHPNKGVGHADHEKCALRLAGGAVAVCWGCLGAGQP
jgi:hypothetical protein